MASVQSSIVRRKGQIHLSKIPPGGLSSKDNPKEFDALVGKAPKEYESRQAQMEASGYQMTFCNEFAGEFGRYVTGTYVGAIDLRKFVLSGAKSYAWVDSSTGALPQYGDIFFCVRPHQHLGVSRYVSAGTHYKVEAGQGGVHYKQDFLKFTQSPWNPADYSGWLDIELFAAPEQKAPPALSPVGKWTVWGSHRRYRWTYTFSDNGNVTWMDVFNGMWGSGKWRVDSKHLIIQWSSGSVDLWYLPMNYANMTGIEDMKVEGTIDIQASKQ